MKGGWDQRAATATPLIVIPVSPQAKTGTQPSGSSIWRGAHLRARRHHRFDLTRDRSNHLGVRTDDTELDREADRRTELEARAR